MALQDQFLQAVAAGKLAEARETLLTSASGPELAYVAELTQVSDLFKAQLRAHAESVAASHRHARMLIVSMALGAVLIAGAARVADCAQYPQSPGKGRGRIGRDRTWQFRYADSRQVERRNRPVLTALGSMQLSLKQRIETDRVAAEENERIRTALDRIGAGAMVADLDGKIIYANDYAKHIFRHARTRDSQATAAVRSEISSASPSICSIATRRTNATCWRICRAAHTADIKLGNALLRILANPVTTSEGKRIGTVVQWLDRTQEVGGRARGAGDGRQGARGRPHGAHRRRTARRGSSRRLRLA
jgi:PAS domain-containing protein